MNRLKPFKSSSGLGISPVLPPRVQETLCQCHSSSSPQGWSLDTRMGNSAAPKAHICWNPIVNPYHNREADISLSSLLQSYFTCISETEFRRHIEPSRQGSLESVCRMSEKQRPGEDWLSWMKCRGVISMIKKEEPSYPCAGQTLVKQTGKGELAGQAPDYSTALITACLDWGVLHPCCALSLSVLDSEQLWQMRGRGSWSCP